MDLDLEDAIAPTLVVLFSVGAMIQTEVAQTVIDFLSKSHTLGAISVSAATGASVIMLIVVGLASFKDTSQVEKGAIGLGVVSMLGIWTFPEVASFVTDNLIAGAVVLSVQSYGFYAGLKEVMG